MDGTEARDFNIAIGGYPQQVLSGKGVGKLAQAGGMLYSIDGPFERFHMTADGYGIIVHSLPTSPGQSGAPVQRKPRAGEE